MNDFDEDIPSPRKRGSSRSTENSKNWRERQAAQGRRQYNRVIPNELTQPLDEMISQYKSGSRLGDIHLSEFLKSDFPQFPDARKELLLTFIQKCQQPEPIDKALYELYWLNTTDAVRKEIKIRTDLRKQMHFFDLGSRVTRLSGWERWLVFRLLKISDKPKIDTTRVKGGLKK